MKCEKCERELTGESVICAGCGHDSSARRDSLLKLTEMTIDRKLPDIQPDANLIKFPTAPPASNPESDSIPDWRTQVRERVRQFREQRPETVVTASAPAEASDLKQNPVVEKALKRLHKSPGQFSDPRATAAMPRELPLTPPYPTQHATRDVRRQTAELQLPSAQPDRRTIAYSQAGTGSNAARTSAGTSSQKSDGQRSPNSEVIDSLPLGPPQPASLWDRTLAGSFDLMLIAVATIPLFSIHSITGLQLGRDAAYTVMGIAIWMTFLYQIWTMLVAGRTCGMAWRNLRVVDVTTREPGLQQWRIFTRSIIATFALLVWPLNLLVIWLSGTQTGLPDLVSRTTVLQGCGQQFLRASSRQP